MDDTSGAIPVDQFEDDSAPAPNPIPVVADESGTPIQSHAPGAPPPVSAVSDAPIPVDQFQDDAPPKGAIPVDHFQDDSQKYGTVGQQYITEAEGLLGGIVSPPVRDAIEIGLGVNPEDIRLRAKTNPYEHGLAEGYGFVFSPYGWAKGLGALGKGIESAAGLSEFAPSAVKLAVNAAKGVAEMTALQGGEELSKLIEKDPDQTASTAALNIGLSGLIGGGIPVALGGAGALWDVTGKPATEAILNKIKDDWTMGNPAVPDGMTIAKPLRQLLTVIGGVPGDTIDSYLAQHAAVNAAPGFDTAVFHILDQVENVNQNLEGSKAALAAAKDQFGKVSDALDDNLKMAKVDARDAKLLADGALDAANLKFEQNLQQNAFDQAPNVVNAVEALKQKGFALSSAAAEGLDNVPGKFDLVPFYNAAKEMQEKFLDLGFPERASALGNVVDNFATRYGEETPYTNVKTIIQGLRQRGNFDFNASEITKGTASSFNALQGVLDSSLKEQVPSYAAAMKPTAEAFSLLGQLGNYGTPEDALNSIRRLTNPAKYTTDIPLLRNLEEQTGANFTRPIDQYASPALRDAMAKNIPEYAKAQSAASALDQLKRPEVQQMMQEALNANPAKTDLDIAEQNLNIAKLRKQGLAGLKPANIESAMKAVMNGNKILAKERFANIPGMQGKSMEEILNLLGIRDQFEKNYTHGSRNVNLWSKAVGGILGLIGHWGGSPIVGGLVGQGLGGLAGGTVDTAGPKVTKALLDKYISWFGDLPKAVGASPEATQAGLVHFLDSDGPVDGTAFKQSVNYLNSAKKGNFLLKGISQDVFKPGLKMIPQHLMPDADKRAKLNGRLQELQSKPTDMFAFGGKVGRYLPKHGEALAKIGASAVNTLNGARPVMSKLSPLDADMEPPTPLKNKFDQSLDVAQQPLLALTHLKNGTLNQSHIAAIDSIYPGLHQRMNQELTNALTDHLANGNSVPYHIRQSLSLMLGQPMDSTMTPQSMQATIAANAQPIPLPGKKGKGSSGKPTEAALDQISKTTDLYQTSDQARAADKRA